MIANRLKQMFDHDEPAFGVVIGWPCPDLVEFMGYLGFDWAFIDAEHGTISRESCEHMVRACRLADMVPFVRVPNHDQGTILGYLETGVMGLIVPHVNTAEEARSVVRAARYSPLGTRGAGSTTRAANYGLTQSPTDYFRRANEAILVMAVIEEVQGIENLEEILAVDGLDIIAIGPGDLALSLNLPGQPGHPKVRELVEQAEAGVLASDKVLARVVGDGYQAHAAAEDGARMVLTGASGLIASAGRGFLQEARSGSLETIRSER